MTKAWRSGIVVTLALWGIASCDEPGAIDPNDTDGMADDADNDGVPASEDCDDGNPAVYPGATETCNGIDDDCNGRIDNAEPVVVIEGLAQADTDTIPNAAIIGVLDYDEERERWVIDNPEDGRTVLRFNEDGNLIEIKADLNKDGTDDERWRATYGEHGWTIIEQDYDDDTDFDRRFEQTFDEDGHAIAGDDFLLPDRTLVDAWRADLDEHGNRTRMRIDHDGDGTFDERVLYDFEPGGLLLSFEHDLDNDGTIDRVGAYTYDDDGNQLKYELDDDNDGFLDRVDERTWNADGKVLSRTIDLGDDGIIDQRETFTYDSNGYPATEWIDTDGDGDADFEATYTVDPDGNLLRSEVDNDGDGDIDIERVYTYDSDGNELTYREDNHQEGTSRSRRRTWNDEGQWTELENDADGDGTYEHKTYRTYGDTGLLRHQRRVIDGVEISTYGYFYCDEDADDDNIVDWNDCDPDDPDAGSHQTDPDCDGSPG